MLEVLLSALSGGRSTAQITNSGHETGLSQFFLCVYQHKYSSSLIEEIIQYSKSGKTAEPTATVLYPGEKTLATRQNNMENGIPVNEKIWSAILEM
jgi:3-dehydro-L-gulonate 2-dehydrogenase